jgi:hypothetical protein
MERPALTNHPAATTSIATAVNDTANIAGLITQHKGSNTATAVITQATAQDYTTQD